MGQVSLKLKAAQVSTVGASCAWEWENTTSSVNSGPNRFPGEESGRDDQTVFVRGFKVSLRMQPLRRSPELLSIVDSKWSDVSSKSTFVPFSHWQPRPEFSSTTDRDLPSSPAGTSGSDSVNSLNYVSNLPHPSDGVNEFLLDCVSDLLSSLHRNYCVGGLTTAESIATVTHDDDSNSRLTEADNEVPENHELISRILNKFTVETTSDGVYLQARSAGIFLSGLSGQQAGLDNVQMDRRLQPPLTSSPCNSALKDSTVDYPDHDCLDSLEDTPDSIETADLEQLQSALGEQNITPMKEGITMRPASTRDRVLQYGAVACSLLKDIGNASNQPYLQAIASISLLIMETAQRVKENLEVVTRIAERVYELVCAIINICRESEAKLAPAMIRCVNFSETLEKILTFVRSQVKGGFRTASFT
ncbi:hypothetical protein C8J57DRAFT_1533149 [Mycena rebaudengoi]|nr:hypothetical protein C8J57DRAFT_1533149 [Mycena rebaudengoi]